MNPWEKQHTLMDISNQKIASSPELNKTSILYSALILEETSELFDGLSKILLRIADEEHRQLFNEVLNVQGVMHNSSLRIRELLKSMPEFNDPLLVDECVELADASTDITVVNCGLAVSVGFNGQDCYDDVADSNLSKANPDTGVIDKTADGKWIKGRDYKEPNLEKVIYGETREKN